MSIIINFRLHLSTQWLIQFIFDIVNIISSFSLNQFLFRFPHEIDENKKNKKNYEETVYLTNNKEYNKKMLFTRMINEEEKISVMCYRKVCLYIIHLSQHTPKQCQSWRKETILSSQRFQNSFISVGMNIVY